jgi:hypothetical protein
MWRATLIIALIGTLSAVPQMARSTKELVFLTRDGCVNTPDMQNNLEDALIRLKWRRDYQIINLATLKKDDPRIGYPTPTILWRDRDIFGLPVPKPPYREPS